MNYDTLIISSTSAEGLNLPVDLGSAYRLSVLQNVSNIRAFRVKDVVIPNTYYTIKTGQLVFGLRGNVSGDQSYAVPQGSYSSVQLAAQIEGAWLALTGTTITLTFSNPDYKLVVARTAGVDATIEITAAQLALTGMDSVLGFYSLIAAATSLTASNIFTITGPQKLLVCSNTLNTGRNMIAKNGMYVRSNVIYATWRQGNSGALSSDIIPGDWQVFQTPQKLSSIDLYLTDENEVAIELNGYPWSITLEFRQDKNV
jgi:hypothetical protein